MTTSNAIAVVDGAVLHGASRHYRYFHLNPDTECDRNRNSADDKDNFIEFLHQVVLYERLVMDWSCLHGKVPPDLVEFFQTAARLAGTPVVERRGLAPHSLNVSQAIAKAVCRSLNSASDDPVRKQNILAIKLPWAYTQGHHEYEMFSTMAAEQDLAPELIPFALFCFRGLCYAGYAHRHARKKSPAVYVASSGRLAALENIAASGILRKVDFARRAYMDLVDILGLPETGYDFSNAFYPHEISPLAIAVEQKSPHEALTLAVKLRQSKEGSRLRREWAERIWASSQSAASGPRHGAHQLMDNVRTIFGNVTQIICASPAAS